MLKLHNDEISLSLGPERGARVVSIYALDQEWLVQREKPLDDIFGTATRRVGLNAAQRGIDFGWNGRMSDHGALLGKPWKTETIGACLETVFEKHQF
jgi:hypothetical protein